MIDAPGPWGTGPFVLTEGYSTITKRTDEVVMEPNETYWDPARKPKVRIVYNNALSKEEAIVAVTDGRVDVVLDLTVDQARDFDGKGKASIHAKAAKTLLAGMFNENKPNSPWTDPELRRAMNMAMDRKMLIEKGAYGYATEMAGLIQTGRYGADESMKAYERDVAAAKVVIEKADIPGREVMILASPDWKSLVEAMAECLKDVGLTVKADYSKTEPEGWDIKLVWHFDWSPQFPVGVVHREMFGANGGLRSSPADNVFDALYSKLLKTPHEPAQEHVVKEVERYVFDQAKVLFLFSPHNLSAVSNRVDFVAYDTCMSELAETTIKAG